VLADRVAERPQLSGIDGLAAARLIAAAVVTPIGGWQAAPALLDPLVLLAGIGVVPAWAEVAGVTSVIAGVAVHRQARTAQGPLGAR